jgi:hypothetical protein
MLPGWGKLSGFCNNSAGIAEEGSGNHLPKPLAEAELLVWGTSPWKAKMEPPRWKIITPSQYEWERRALDFIRCGLPNHDPYRAWANFEFQTPDGAIYEFDLLVLTKQGFWLVEIKSWPGRVGGDAGTWTRTRDGPTISEDNPVLLANRKSKALISLLKSQQAVKKVRVPWLDAVVFLSADDIQCDLTGPARNRVLLKDRPADNNQAERARKREGWDAKRLMPLLAGLDQLLPWIHQWHPEVDPEFGETAGQSFQTMLEGDAHELGLTLEDIRVWEPPKRRQPRKARSTRKRLTSGEEKQ